MPDTGCAERTAGSEGEEGAAVRLVVDEECEGVPGVSGSDEEPVACDYGLILVEFYAGAGQAEGVGVGLGVLASLSHQPRKRLRKPMVMGMP